MTKLNEFIEELANRGIVLVADGDQLRIRARQGAITPELRERIASRKSELLEMLLERSKFVSTTDLPQIVPDLANRYEPFSLTDIQHAYWVGRDNIMELGNIAVHAYIEIEHSGLDVTKLDEAFNALIRRHDMLRVVIDGDGEQHVLASVPEYCIATCAFTKNQGDAAEAHLDETRAMLSHQILNTHQWPLFDVRATLYGSNSVRLHISIDILIADLWSLFRLFGEWRQLYDDPTSVLPPLDITFRDYVLAEKSLEDTSFFQVSRSYWQNRLAQLPAGPDLPIATLPAAITKPRFVRRKYELNKRTWTKLKKAANSLGVTPSGLLLSAFSEVLTRWARTPRFTLNLTLFNRLPLHPQVNTLIGDFTTTILLAIDNSGSGGFSDRARRIQERLYADMEHRFYSGVRVLRDLSQRRAGMPGAVMPVVFSSALGLGSLEDESMVATGLGGQLGEVVYTITQTPQVWIDHQVFENDGALCFNWDVLEELFPPGLINDMFGAYCELLERLAVDPWVGDTVLLPPIPQSQRKIREQTNATNAEMSDSLLHELVLSQARRNPEAVAVINEQLHITYAELVADSTRLARWLQSQGARPNNLIAVVLDKGWEQVVAVLGILNSGAAYLPIDPDLPDARRKQLMEQGEVSVVVTRTDIRDRLEWPETVTLVCVDDTSLSKLSTEPLTLQQRSDDLAYVIFTSGSTGVPKGVAIEHRAVVNTLLDINARFGVTNTDRVLAVSALGFDLSVYDIFGVLAAGGTVVLPNSTDSKDVAHWWDLILREKITLWNSVPVLMQMLIDYVENRKADACPDLRLALLSGDWIPLDLPERLRLLWKDLEMVSLGGATEVSIWSICYPVSSVESSWTSIPYGKPLANQKFHVFDENLRPCPDWSIGELYIGGTGLARGYWKDEMKTRSSFITHPTSGERLYRTGDLGRYWPDGNIEFFGRTDSQVKINGYRIELGEIESIIKTNPLIKDVVVNATSDDRGQKQLVAYLVRNETYAITSMMLNDDGRSEISQIRQFLSERLPSYMVPASYLFVSEIPLTANGKVNRNALPEPNCIEKDSSIIKEGPRNRDEEQVAAIFATVLRVNAVGIHDSFFELGGDSLLATRLVASVSKALDVELHLRDLFNGPTVAELAARVSSLRSHLSETIKTSQSELVTEEEGYL